MTLIHFSQKKMNLSVVIPAFWQNLLALLARITERLELFAQCENNNAHLNPNLNATFSLKYEENKSK